jgi:hypothetical protein
MDVAPSTVYKWVSAGLAAIAQETAEELRRVIDGAVPSDHPEAHAADGRDVPKDVLDGIS